MSVTSLTAQPGKTKTKTGEIKLVHTAPEAEALPRPGMPLTLKVWLTNTKRTTDRVLLVGTKDGSFFEATSTKSFLNENDMPLYEFTLTAPLSELRYRFILYASGSEMPIASALQLVQRSCMPTVIDPNLLDEEQADGSDRMRQLLRQSRALEQESALFETTANLTDELKRLLNKD